MTGLPERCCKDKYMDTTQLYSEKEIYRPFWERNSAFLEVETGCSWHRCAFCDFARDSFSLFPIDEIQKKIELLAPYVREKKSIFLLGENPLVMPTQKLLLIFQSIRKHMPWMEQINMYARFDDVLKKAPKEIMLLRKNGLHSLYLGLESGNDEVLKLMSKGETASQAVEACSILRAAGVEIGLSAITGLGGKERSFSHAKDTAEILNSIRPGKIWMMGLLVWPDTPLATLVDQGKFHPLTQKEKAEEEILLLSGLEHFDCIFADTTVMGKYTLIGQLATEKERMIQWLHELECG
ncbi:radical SAM protein [uncultured Merdimonas sp.]|uniref:radical SAM protein n=1 Tax=uncultured Merdimonas sp. TaxID=2023269 RepID=UPI00320A60A9